MKHIFFFLLMIFTFSSIWAQQNHFLYFQSENNQSFYVKLDNKVYSSGATGYIIVPKLKEGEYTITVGFPQNQWPEQKISYKLSRDAGYLLKNYPDKGWGLSDLQSSSVIMAEGGMKQDKPQQQVRNDEFSNMLAAVVNDSTIKEKEVPEEDKKVTKKTTAAVADNSDENKGAGAEATPSVIRKSLQTKGKDGMEMVYIDEYKGQRDTIRIFIPLVKSQEQKESGHPGAAAQAPEKAGDPASNQDGQEKKFTKQDNSLQLQGGSPEPKELSEPVAAVQKQEAKAGNSDETVDTFRLRRPAEVDSSSNEVMSAEEKADTADLVFKNDVQNAGHTSRMRRECKDHAAETDFFKLRKKMAAEAGDDDMIKVAKKAFKSKCFSTGYVKNLAALFLKDEGKYNFFDVAYPLVSDPDAFSTLESQLSDPYYIKRFKVMIHE